MRRAPLAIALFLPLLAGCLLDSRAQLDVEKWEQEKPKLVSYSYVLTRGCECTHSHAGPFFVRATPHEVIDVRRIADGGTDTVAVTEAVQSYSIDSLIVEARSRLARTHASASVRNNITYGFPEFVYIDFNVAIADEEYQWEITNFTAIAGD